MATSTDEPAIGSDSMYSFNASRGLITSCNNLVATWVYIRCGFQFAVTQQGLDHADTTPYSSRWLAKLCLRQYIKTYFPISASLAAAAQAPLNWRVLRGSIACWPGNKQPPFSISVVPERNTTNLADKPALQAITWQTDPCVTCPAQDVTPRAVG